MFIFISSLKLRGENTRFTYWECEPRWDNSGPDMLKCWIMSPCTLYGGGRRWAATSVGKYTLWFVVFFYFLEKSLRHHDRECKNVWYNTPVVRGGPPCFLVKFTVFNILNSSNTSTAWSCSGQIRHKRYKSARGCIFPHNAQNRF